MTRKRFGQHFLTDRHALGRIADALALAGTETVIEVGPGKGALTDLLVDRCARLICIEIDRDFVAFLQSRYHDRPQVTIVSADVLDTDLGVLAGGPYALVGNVPYYVTTPILFHALKTPRPTRSVFLVQREVADRLVAQPGTKAYGALSVNVQLVAQVEVVGQVSAGSFFPRPTVESSIVRLRPRAVDLAVSHDEGALRAFVIGCFGQRRRQLPRAIRTVTGIGATQAADVVRAAGINPRLRCEDLAPAEFVALWSSLVRAERLT